MVNPISDLSRQIVAVKHQNNERTVRVKIESGRRLPAELLQELCQHALTRGVSKLNLLEPSVQLQYVRVTCQSMTIPLAVLDYVVKEKLSLELLEQPELLLPNVDAGIFGRGMIIALRGVAIGNRVEFQTSEANPIIIRENCTLEGPLKVSAGTVFPAGTIFKNGVRMP
jgi:hypothetical protein